MRYSPQQIEQARANKLHELGGKQMVDAAKARLARCIANGDERGADYNRRQIARYERYLAIPYRPVKTPAIPFKQAEDL